MGAGASSLPPWHWHPLRRCIPYHSQWSCSRSCCVSVTQPVCDRQLSVPYAINMKFRGLAKLNLRIDCAQHRRLSSRSSTLAYPSPSAQGIQQLHLRSSAQLPCREGLTSSDL
eukprot:2507954-Rhodomonas_salina.1